MSVWSRVIGQERAVLPLRQAAVDPAAMTHAWLITGPPGSGRSVAARAFAAALQCPDGGCGTCHHCTTVLAGTNADVMLAATENVLISINEVRELVALSARAPAAGRWRVILVEDADRMTERTSNVLLKAIEEPASRTVWLLCAPSPNDVTVTIRSRCRQVRLRIPSAEAITQLLITQDGVDAEAARRAALAAQCHIGVARRLARDPAARTRRQQVLELPGLSKSVGQAVLAAGELVEVAQAEARAVAEERDAGARAELLRLLGADQTASRQPPAVRAQLRQFDDDAKRRAARTQRDVLDRALVDLLSFYRDVLMVQCHAGLELINAEHVDAVADAATTSTAPQTLARLDAVEQARQRLAGNVAPALALEAMAVRLALTPAS